MGAPLVNRERESYTFNWIETAELLARETLQETEQSCWHQMHKAEERCWYQMQEMVYRERNRERNLVKVCKQHEVPKASLNEGLARLTGGAPNYTQTKYRCLSHSGSQEGRQCAFFQSILKFIPRGGRPACCFIAGIFTAYRDQRDFFSREVTPLDLTSTPAYPTSAHYAAAKFPKIFEALLKTGQEIPLALSNTCCAIDCLIRIILQKREVGSCHSKITAGCTALICCVQHRKGVIHTATVGDMAAAIYTVRRGEVLSIPLSSVGTFARGTDGWQRVVKAYLEQGEKKWEERRLVLSNGGDSSGVLRANLESLKDPSDYARRWSEISGESLRPEVVPIGSVSLTNVGSLVQAAASADETEPSRTAIAGSLVQAAASAVDREPGRTAIAGLLGDTIFPGLVDPTPSIFTSRLEAGDWLVMTSSGVIDPELFKKVITAVSNQDRRSTAWIESGNYENIEDSMNLMRRVSSQCQLLLKQKRDELFPDRRGDAGIVFLLNPVNQEPPQDVP